MRCLCSQLSRNMRRHRRLPPASRCAVVAVCVCLGAPCRLVIARAFVGFTCDQCHTELPDSTVKTGRLTPSRAVDSPNPPEVQPCTPSRSTPAKRSRLATACGTPAPAQEACKRQKTGGDVTALPGIPEALVHMPGPPQPTHVEAEAEDGTNAECRDNSEGAGDNVGHRAVDIAAAEPVVAVDAAANHA